MVIMRAVLIAIAVFITFTTLASASSYSVSSSDGLSLLLSDSGEPLSIAINGTSLPMLAAQGGFSFREVLTDAPNLIANPGFEDGAVNPLNWSFVTTSGNTPAWDTIAHSGARAIKISIPGTSDNKSGYPKSDLIKAEPLQYYTFSTWLKAEGAGGKNAPAVRVVELDSNKKWITQTNLIFSNGTYDWTQNKITFRAGINTSYLYVYANIWEGYGTFWLDDVELAPFFGPTISLNGALTQNPDGTVTQRARANDIDFTFYYIPKERYIELQGEIQDLRGEDRALQVMFDLPVNLTGWYWNDDGNKSRKIVENLHYDNISKNEPLFSKYHFASIDNGLDKGISIALSPPSKGYNAYNIKNGYYEQVYLGAPFSAKLTGSILNFSMAFYQSGAGFRNAEDKYSQIYTPTATPTPEPTPESFEGNTSRVSNCNATIAYSRGIIYVYGKNAWADLTCINMIINNTSIIQDLGNKQWLAKAPIYVNQSTTKLFINDSDTNWLKLESLNNSGISYLNVKGSIEINNTIITSWNTTSNSPAPQSDTLRSYIVISSNNNSIKNSNLSYLGYSASNKYGLTIAGITNIITNISSIKNYRGISLHGDSNTIENSTISDTEGSGISILNDYSTIRNNTLIRAGGVGIYMYIANYTIVSNNTVSYSNTTGLSDVPNAAGIRGFHSDHNIIENNSVLFNSRFGIYFDGKGNNNSIRDNYIYSSIGSGIFLESGVMNSIIEKNVIENNGGYGIFLYKESWIPNPASIYNTANNIVTNNTIANNSLGGIKSRAAFNNHLISNNIYNGDYPVIFDYMFESISIIGNVTNYLINPEANISVKNNPNSSVEINYTEPNMIFIVDTNKKTYPFNIVSGKSFVNLTSAGNFMINKLNGTIIIPSLNNVTAKVSEWKINDDYKKSFHIGHISESTNITIIAGDFPKNTLVQAKINETVLKNYMTNEIGYINFSGYFTDTNIVLTTK